MKFEGTSDTLHHDDHSLWPLTEKAILVNILKTLLRIEQILLDQQPPAREVLTPGKPSVRVTK